MKENKAKEKKTTKEVEDIQSHNYDYKNKESIDNHNGAEFLLGFYVESRNVKNINKTVEDIRNIVIKNLSKDPLFYVKNGQFGIKDLGYVDKAPGLGKTKEVTGKFKSSGMEPVKINESKKFLKEEVKPEDLQKGKLYKYSGEITGGPHKGEKITGELEFEKKINTTGRDIDDMFSFIIRKKSHILPGQRIGDSFITNRNGLKNYFSNLESEDTIDEIKNKYKNIREVSNDPPFSKASISKNMLTTTNFLGGDRSNALNKDEKDMVFTIVNMLMQDKNWVNDTFPNGPKETEVLRLIFQYLRENYSNKPKEGLRMIEKEGVSKFMNGLKKYIGSYKKLNEASKKKPSAGLTKKEKSKISKQIHKGQDIGKKGKGFEKIAKAAEKQYGSKEAGQKVAAAKMWSSLAKRKKKVNEDFSEESENIAKKIWATKDLDQAKQMLINAIENSKTDEMFKLRILSAINKFNTKAGLDYFISSSILGSDDISLA